MYTGMSYFDELLSDYKQKKMPPTGNSEGGNRTSNALGETVIALLARVQLIPEKSPRNANVIL